MCVCVLLYKSFHRRSQQLPFYLPMAFWKEMLVRNSAKDRKVHCRGKVNQPIKYKWKRKIIILKRCKSSQAIHSQMTRNNDVLQMFLHLILLLLRSFDFSLCDGRYYFHCRVYVFFLLSYFIFVAVFLSAARFYSVVWEGFKCFGSCFFVFIIYNSVSTLRTNDGN